MRTWGNGFLPPPDEGSTVLTAVERAAIEDHRAGGALQLPRNDREAALTHFGLRLLLDPVGGAEILHLLSLLLYTAPGISRWYLTVKIVEYRYIHPRWVFFFMI